MWRVVKRLGSNSFEFMLRGEYDTGFRSYEEADSWMRFEFYDGKAPQNCNYFVVMVPLV